MLDLGGCAFVRISSPGRSDESAARQRTRAAGDGLQPKLQPCEVDDHPAAGLKLDNSTGLTAHRGAWAFMTCPPGAACTRRSSRCSAPPCLICMPSFTTRSRKATRSSPARPSTAPPRGVQGCFAHRQAGEHQRHRHRPDYQRPGGRALERGRLDAAHAAVRGHSNPRVHRLDGGHSPPGGGRRTTISALIVR